MNRLSLWFLLAGGCLLGYLAFEDVVLPPPAGGGANWLVVNFGLTGGLMVLAVLVAIVWLAQFRRMPAEDQA